MKKRPIPYVAPVSDLYCTRSAQRFGARTTFFVLPDLSFDEINKSTFEHYFANKSRLLIGGKETDYQITIEIDEDVYDVQPLAGTLQKNEAENILNLSLNTFKKYDIYLSIDYLKTDNLFLDGVPKLLKKQLILSSLY